MPIREYLVSDSNELDVRTEKTTLVPFKGRVLVVLQVGEKTEYDEELQELVTEKPYVVVPGFKVGGSHKSKCGPHPEALDVDAVHPMLQSRIEKALRPNFVGEINFW